MLAKANVNGKKRKGAASTPQPSKNKRAPRVQVFTEGEESLRDGDMSFLGQGSQN